MRFLRPLALLFVLSVFAAACKKQVDPRPVYPVLPFPPGPEKPSEMVFRFSPVVQGQVLTGDSTYYTNAVGDHFTVTKFNYYISHVKLVREDDSVVAEQESYHLIRHFEGLESFTLTNVPAGRYKRVEFIIGVDSARNVDGAQSGDLDPAHLMFWDWNTGYIFYKLEGAYKALSAAEGEYGFHIGGFAGPDKAIEQVALGLDGSAVVAEKTICQIHVFADASEVFDTPEPLGFDTYFQATPSQRLNKRQSGNYRDMFSVDMIQVINK